MLSLYAQQSGAAEIGPEEFSFRAFDDESEIGVWRQFPHATPKEMEKILKTKKYTNASHLTLAISRRLKEIFPIGSEMQLLRDDMENRGFECVNRSRAWRGRRVDCKRYFPVRVPDFIVDQLRKLLENMEKGKDYDRLKEKIDLIEQNREDATIRIEWAVVILHEDNILKDVRVYTLRQGMWVGGRSDDTESKHETEQP